MTNRDMQWAEQNSVVADEDRGFRIFVERNSLILIVVALVLAVAVLSWPESIGLLDVVRGELRAAANAR